MSAAFRLAFALVLCASGTALAQASRLEPGDLRFQSGELYDVHELQGLAGQTLQVRLVSDEFDPYLVVVAPDGTVLVQVDDAPGLGLNAAAELTLAASGTYLIVVTSAFPGESGGYTLTVTTAGSAVAPGPGTKATIGAGQAAAAPTAPASPTAPGAPSGAATGTAPALPTSAEVLPAGLRESPPALAGSPVPVAQPRPGYVTGTVFDTRGRPLAGAGVLVQGTAFASGEQVSFETVTGADGTYAVRVPDGRYRARAWVDVRYQGVLYSRLLHPLAGSLSAEVDSSVGGTLDFQWALTGRIDPYGTDSNAYHGATIELGYCGLPADAYCSRAYQAFPDRPIAPGGSTVLVTLTPVAPLIDGSPGRPITFDFTVAPQDPDYPRGGAPNAPAGFEAGGGGRVVLGRDWEYRREHLYDVPVGVYDVSAVAVFPDGRTQGMLLGLSPDDVEHASVRVTFRPWEGFSGRSYRAGGLYETEVFIRD